MDKDFEQRYFALEDRHWWHSSRRDMLVRLIAGLPRGVRILDVGCAGGMLLRALSGRGFGNISGVDISSGAIEACQKQGIAGAVAMDAQELTFPDGAFDVVIASDILEHVSDPGRALRSWRRVLKDGGRLIVFVPGHAFLWSGHDVLNHHQKRYAKKDLIAVLRTCGFDVMRCSGWNVGLFLPAVVMAVVRRMTDKADKGAAVGLLHATPPVLNGVLTAWLRAENRILARHNAPVGITFFAVARKSNDEG